MINSLRNKLVVSYLSIALLTAGCIFLLIRETSNQRLEQIILDQELSELQGEITRWYEIEGDWDGFRQYFLALHPPPPRTPAGGDNNGSENNNRGGSSPSSRGQHGIVDAERRLLNNYLGFSAGDILPLPLFVDPLPVVVDGATVAWVVPDDATGISLQAEERVFIERTNQVVLIASVVAVGASLLTGWGLANVIIRPISSLTEASERMAEGDLKQQVDIISEDEIGRLAASFNSMSHKVALANERRRQLTADIAHDLSTPLHIALGYLEVIQSGTQPATPEQLGIIELELNHLNRLINDLDVLAQADTNTLHLDIGPAFLEDILPYVITSFKPHAQEKRIALYMNPLAVSLPPVMADDVRLVQVLGNILSNGIRFTPSGGVIELSAEHSGDDVCVRVHDSGVGITAEDLPYVFDRFYQADKSRGQSGKMGLGLAISKELIEAMGGQIVAGSAAGKGTTISVYLPVSPL